MLQTRRATCATARRRRIASTAAFGFRLSSGSAHQAPPCPPSLGGRSPGESTKRASRATNRDAMRRDADNLRTSTWTTRRKLPPPRPSDRMPTPIPASCATPASERKSPDQPPPSPGPLLPNPPFRCRRALFFGECLKPRAACAWRGTALPRSSPSAPSSTTGPAGSSASPRRSSRCRLRADA